MKLNQIVTAMWLAHNDIVRDWQVISPALGQLFISISAIVAIIIVGATSVMGLFASAEYLGIDVKGIGFIFFALGYSLTAIMIGLYGYKTYKNYINITRQLDH